MKFSMVSTPSPRISRSGKCDIFKSIVSNAMIAFSWSPALCNAACFLS